MRKRRAKRRILLPDPKFESILVTRFVNNLMLDGKKNTAFKCIEIFVNTKFEGGRHKKRVKKI